MLEISNLPNGVAPKVDSTLQPSKTTEDLGIEPSVVLYITYRSERAIYEIPSGLMKIPEPYMSMGVYSNSGGTKNLI